MTTTTATLRMLLLICISLGQIRLVSMQSATVPVDGVYIITMVADPDGRTDMFLQLNGRDAGFVAYGTDNAIQGLVVAVYLKAGTRVSARYTGDWQGATTLGVAFASYDKDSFVTVRSNGYSSRTSNTVHFHNQYTADQGWKTTPATERFWLDKTGIYWVAARPDCGSGNVDLSVGNGRFHVYCSGDKAISASGAFYFRARTALKLTFSAGGNLQGGTSFSFVLLEGNKDQAYTAWVDRTGKLSPNEKLSFRENRWTDYGFLYNAALRTWTIRKTGSYIVSMRGDPDSNTLKVIFYKNNDQYLFAWYNEEGTKSGQAGVFQFAEGDKLYMVDPYGRYVGTETFMSIALLWAASE